MGVDVAPATDPESMSKRCWGCFELHMNPHVLETELNGDSIDIYTGMYNTCIYIYVYIYILIRVEIQNNWESVGIGQKTRICSTARGMVW